MTTEPTITIPRSLATSLLYACGQAEELWSIYQAQAEGDTELPYEPKPLEYCVERQKQYFSFRNQLRSLIDELD